MYFSRCLMLFLTLAGSLAAAADNQLSEAEKQQGWILLFNGKTLDGWITSDKKTSQRPVEAGSINPHKSGHYMMVHEKKWENFVLVLDFKISKRCNSGIFFRTSSLQPQSGRDVGFNGMEIAVDDTTTAGYHDTGAIYDLVKPSVNAMKPVGQWNQLKLFCNRNRISVTINGKQVSRMDTDHFSEPN
ncbi:MAG: DUF1080 domain-containing protein, partial [Pirellulaceae bacterium]|nr:DUF1080 domain-containing protein [Pirellulaceae bacterium]